MKKRVYILTLVFLILFLDSSSAVTYYVDKNLTIDCMGDYSILGRDCSGNNGTAYNTISEAVFLTVPGYSPKPDIKENIRNLILLLGSLILIVTASVITVIIYMRIKKKSEPHIDNNFTLPLENIK
jgi:hypothetical protein